MVPILRPEKKGPHGFLARSERRYGPDWQTNPAESQVQATSLRRRYSFCFILQYCAVYSRNHVRTCGKGNGNMKGKGTYGLRRTMAKQVTCFVQIRQHSLMAHCSKLFRGMWHCEHLHCLGSAARCSSSSIFVSFETTIGTSHLHCQSPCCIISLISVFLPAISLSPAPPLLPPSEYLPVRLQQNLNACGPTVFFLIKLCVMQTWDTHSTRSLILVRTNVQWQCIVRRSKRAYRRTQPRFAIRTQKQREVSLVAIRRRARVDGTPAAIYYYKTGFRPAL